MSHINVQVPDMQIGVLNILVQLLVLIVHALTPQTVMARVARLI